MRKAAVHSCEGRMIEDQEEKMPTSQDDNGQAGRRQAQNDTIARID